MSVALIVATLLLMAAATALVPRFLPRPLGDRGIYEGDITLPQGGLVVLTALWTILALITVVVFAVMYFGSVGERVSLEAFYRDTIGTYEHTILATGEVEISAAQPGIIDVAYLGQAEVVGERIVELRDEIANYNRRLRWFRTFNGMFLADGFLADLPEDMKPIQLTDLDRVPGVAEKDDEG